ncbi:hypothetical protein AB0H58_04795 [Nocardia neocaledoniensis]|uniref:DUF7373 family lipoprotein n=1 Tax=Nocardia neocaledoniensis TaxID=236511 RepID=UPI003409AF62
MRKIRVGSALLTLGLVLSGCGDGGEDATSSAPAIDIATLDSGNYPTSPTNLEATRVPTSGALQESIRIGAATPYPFQYDPRFIFAKGSGGGRHITQADPPYFRGTGIESKDFNALVPGVVAGWRSNGDRRDEANAGRTVETNTIRFETADHARSAATDLFQRTPGSLFQVPNYPDAYIKVEDDPEPIPVQTLRAALVRGDILLHIQVEDWLGLPYDAAADALVAQQFFDKQIEMLRSYTPTPLSDIDKLPLDHDNLLAHALPTEETSRPKGTSSAAVYPAQAVLHMEDNAQIMSPAFADAGIDYAAFDAGSIYRSRDESAANRFLAAMNKATVDDRDYAEVARPANLPTTNCFDKNPAEKHSFVRPICHGIIGRFVFAVSGTNIQDVHQRAAAQYKLLAALE